MGAPFKDLVVWQRAMDLSVAVYGLTQSFPDSERFGLTNQLRRASVSVASNIAEGYGRSTKGEYLLFLGHARGSLFEVETQLDLAHRLGFTAAEPNAPVTMLAVEVGRMLIVLMSRVEQSQPRGKKSLTAH